MNVELYFLNFLLIFEGFSIFLRNICITIFLCLLLHNSRFGWSFASVSYTITDIFDFSYKISCNIFRNSLQLPYIKNLSNISNPHQSDEVEVATFKSKTDETQRKSPTPFERKSCRSLYFFSGNMSWGCLRKEQNCHVYKITV